MGSNVAEKRATGTRGEARGMGSRPVYAGVEDKVSRDCEYVYRYYGY